MDGNSSEEEHVPNKAQFVDQLANSLDGDRKRAAAALEAVIENVYAAISRGERVAISGFGVFERRERAARMGRNPATGAPVQVPASRVPAFRPGEEFRRIAKGDGGSGAAKSTAKKSAAKKSTAKKSAAKKSTAKKASPAKKSTAKKASPAKKSTAKKASPAKKSTAKKSAKKAPAKKR